MGEFTYGALAVVASALLLTLMHWAGKCLVHKPLPAWLNYVLGSGAILAGHAIWEGLLGNLAPAGRLAVLYALAGGMVILMYLLEAASAGQDHEKRANAIEDRHTGETDDSLT